MPPIAESEFAGFYDDVGVSATIGDATVQGLFSREDIDLYGEDGTVIAPSDTPMFESFGSSLNSVSIGDSVVIGSETFIVVRKARSKNQTFTTLYMHDQVVSP